MKKIGTPVPGVVIKDGKVVVKERKPRDVSEAIRRKKSRRSKCVTKAQAVGFNAVRRGKSPRQSPAEGYVTRK